MKNLSTGSEASDTGESLNSGDPAVHPGARHSLLISTFLRYSRVMRTDSHVISCSVYHSYKKFQLWLMAGVLRNLSAMMVSVPFVEFLYVYVAVSTRWTGQQQQQQQQQQLSCCSSRAAATPDDCKCAGEKSQTMSFDSRSGMTVVLVKCPLSSVCPRWGSY